MASLLATKEAPNARPARLQRVASGVRAEVAFVSALLLVALLARIPHLTLVPHFTDEAWEVLWSLPIVRGESFPLTNFNSFKGALFNYLVAASFLLLGPSAMAARLVALVAGVLTVLATYLVARAWAGKTAALLAAALLAANGAHVLVNSHIAWSNCITPLFTTLAIWTLYVATEASKQDSARIGRRAEKELLHKEPLDVSPSGNSRIWRARGRAPLLLLLSALLWGLAFQTHPAVAAFLPGAAAYVLWRSPRLLRTPWPYVGILAFLTGWANLLVYNLASGPRSLLDAQQVRENYQADQAAATSYPAALGDALLLQARILGGAVDSRQGPWSYVLDPLVLLAVALPLAGLVHLTRRGNPLPILLTLSYLAVLPAINPKFNTLVHSRYLMPLTPVLLAATAALLATCLDTARAKTAQNTRAGGSSSWAYGRPRLVKFLPSPLKQRIAAMAAALVLLLGPLLPLARYYERAFARGETNQRVYDLARLVSGYGQPFEPVVLDESFGGEIGWGVSELRGLRYLLALQNTPVQVMKITPRRLEAELGASSSLLVVLNGRRLRDFDRLPLEPLTAAPQRGAEVGLFRLAERGMPRKQAGS